MEDVNMQEQKKKRASRLSNKLYGGKLRFFLSYDNTGKSVGCQEKSCLR